MEIADFLNINPNYKTIVLLILYIIIILFNFVLATEASKAEASLQRPEVLFQTTREPHRLSAVISAPTYVSFILFYMFNNKSVKNVPYLLTKSDIMNSVKPGIFFSG